MGYMILAIGVASVYLFLQLYYLWYWRKTPAVEVPADYIPSTDFSVVVVARDEEKTIEQCIQGILKQHYPQDLFEIIVIDDRSTDRTVEMVKNINSSVIRLFHLQDYPELIHPPAFKKSAIELAVRHDLHDWIIMTDADCIVPPGWLRSIAYAQSITDAVFFAAPLRYASQHSMLEKMQEMEMSVLMLITASGIRSGLHDIANGANMAFSKQAFLEVRGYEGNYQYASGDDMFLIEKMRKFFPGKIAFVKSTEAIVETMPHQDWNSLLKQRIRWSGKNKGLRSPVIPMIWAFVGFYHLMIFVMILLAILHLLTWWPFFILLIIKWIADSILIYHASKFFKKRSMLLHFLPLQVMYSFYILSLSLVMATGKKSDW